MSDAFAEDPVRILRLARFAARFEGFRWRPETMALMTAMVEAGEVDALVAERVWQEFAKGLMARRPSRMFEILRECGALARLLPGLALGARLLGAWMRPPSKAARLPVRWALIAGGAGDEALASTLRAPQGAAECRDLAVLLARERAALAGSGAGDAQTCLRCSSAATHCVARAIAELVAAAGLLDGPVPPARPPACCGGGGAGGGCRCGGAGNTRSRADPGAVHAARLAALPALA